MKNCKIGKRGERVFQKLKKLVRYFLRKCAVKEKWSGSLTNSPQRVKDY